MDQNKWIIIGIVILFIIFIHYNNTKASKTEANPGDYSGDGNYSNITPMKHDIFKQLTIDIAPFIIIGIAQDAEWFSINNFPNSIIGRSLLAGLGYSIYYQIVEPQLVNRLPKF